MASQDDLRFTIEALAPGDGTTCFTLSPPTPDAAFDEFAVLGGLADLIERLVATNPAISAADRARAANAAASLRSC
jgi:hypothetical protein